MFHHSVVSSIILYALVRWSSSPRTAHTNRANKLIRRAGSVLPMDLESVEERRMLSKSRSITDNVSAPAGQSSFRTPQGVLLYHLSPFRCRTNHLTGTIYVHISVHNGYMWNTPYTFDLLTCILHVTYFHKYFMNILQNYPEGILKWYIFVFKDHRRKTETRIIRGQNTC